MMEHENTNLIGGQVRLTGDELQAVFLSAFKAAHASMYYGLSNHRKVNIIQGFIEGSHLRSKFMTMMENDRLLKTDHSPREICSELMWHTLNPQSQKEQNPWLLPRRFPENNCDNFNMPEDSVKKRTSELKITMATVLEASLNHRESSCFTCSRDRNSYSKEQQIFLYDSALFRKPMCRMSVSSLPNNNHGFRIHIHHDGKNSWLRKITMGSKLKAQFIMSLNQIGEHTQISIAKRVANLIELDEGVSEMIYYFNFKKSGTSHNLLHLIEKQGHMLKSKLGGKDFTTIESSAKMYNTLVEYGTMIQRCSNPKLFKTVREVLEPLNSLSLHRLNNSNDYWPLEYVSASTEGLVKINQQASLMKLEGDTIPFVFKLEEEIPTSSDFRISVAQVLMWS
jgi:hypothetical protein